ncbi:GTP-binding and nucleic acid-binding protein YchF [invertebrate metagenome]|uniref:GTP-binding and nucleic acid-binding protein YchF n=1 Tax=invertebrate metagenome TaxID=1711999 RepID=A0A484H7Q9_9ZZZZ
MGFNCGIVGLPNVGKSTLFNALTSTMAAQTANYPFCTVEPNIGFVAVPDERLPTLACIGRSARVVATQIAFVDIAGLIRGASRGEGLGNQFLAHIRSCDAVAHVLRCFEDEQVAHIEGSVDPLRDAEMVEAELMLADLESLERRASPIAKKVRAGDKEAKAQIVVIEALLEVLRAGRPARSIRFDNPEQVKIQQRLFLLTAKPMLYICNVEESAAVTGNSYSKQISSLAKKSNIMALCLSAAAEAEIAQLSEASERQVFLATLNLVETGLSKLMKAGYHMLDLITFFTVGPQETRAWTVRRGTRALEAAGMIHSDFKKGFIRAATIAYADFLACNGEQGAREAGKVRLEGRDYTVVDGDVIHFLFNL